MDAARLVFIDESAAKTNMTRLRGRALKGQRAHDHAPSGHWCTTTMISSIRLDGEKACMMLEGALSGEIFEIYVETILVPTLRPGDIVIMDNLASHKSEAITAHIEAAHGKVIFLPPYSPDLNPIEKMWSKLKEYLRSAKARTEDALTNAVAQALNQITALDAIGWFAACGYTTV